MDIKGLVNMFLSSATDLAKQGRQGAENALNIPAEGQARTDTLSTLGKGVLGGGALGLLLGSKSGRKLGKTALQVGGTAALAAVAYKTYQKWQDNKGESSVEVGEPQATLNHQPQAALASSAPFGQQERESLLLLSAMIAAAKADGHIDNAEQNRIQAAVQSMGATTEVNQFVEQELSKPLDPAEVATLVNTPEEAAEVYLASAIMIDEQNFMEKAYLQELAKQLGLVPELVAELEAQVSA